MSGRGQFEGLGEAALVAEIRLDASGKRALRAARVFRPQRIPVEGVIPCLRRVIEQWRHCRVGSGAPGALPHDRLERAGRERGVLDERVGLVDVAAMVLAVVGLQRRTGDQRLERLVGVGQIWQFDRH
ncbi:hypothetical protein D3C83_16320 [compost metagenome]